MINETLLNKYLDDIICKKYIFSAVLRIESGDGSFSWVGSRGEMKSDSKFFIASITKLYVTAVIMSLIEERKLSLDDKILEYLPDHYMEDLHVFKGVDYSGKITIEYLLSNTSGLPDYFNRKDENNNTQFDLLIQGKDISWDIEETISYIKKMKPKFAPGKKGKADYSDTNFLLLGKIIENVAGKGIEEVFRKYIFEKIGLNNTYLFNDVDDKSPVDFYFKSKKFESPKYMTSITAEGGIVSTADEVLFFTKEFFKGRFFPKEKIENLKKWNLLLPPPGMFYFGIGIEKSFTPRILTPLNPNNEILGFWGQTGSFTWHNPDTDLYFSGTTNQANGSGHNAAMTAIMKIIKSAL